MSIPPSSKQRYFRYRRRPPANADDDNVMTDKQRRAHHLRQYRDWLRPYRAGLGLVFVLALISMGLELVLPLATRYIIDDILLAGSSSASDMRTLHLVAGGVAVLLLLAQVLQAWRTYYMSVLNARVVFSLRRRLYRRMIRLPLAALSDMKAGGAVSRLSTDVDNVTGLIQMAVISPGVALVKMLMTLVILFFIKWQLALAAVTLLPPLIYLSLLWIRRGRPIYRSLAEDRAAVDGRVAETFGGIRVVRSFGRERKEAFDYAIGHHTIIRKKILAGIIEMVVDTGWNFIIPLISLLIVWFGGALALGGQASIGDIVAFQMYSTMLLFPIWRIIFSLSQTQQALASMDRVFDILDKKEDKPDAPDAPEAPAAVETVRFEDVSFAYVPDRKVIHNVNLTVKAGQMVAFVGPSGAGKTTLADLVARFHDPTSGRILLNGRDLRSFSLASYRRLLGVVQQDVFLFDGTVRDNLAYGRPDATDEDIVAAAQKAHAHDFIMELTDGYDTVIGERGVKLSGGQRQRLSIARAILADPRILILDEATSNLDSESEQQIQIALKELFKGRTTFVIAHRLSTVAHADLIVVVAAGRVVETGTHQSLLAAGGLYSEMVERQQRSIQITL